MQIKAKNKETKIIFKIPHNLILKKKTTKISQENHRKI